MPKPERVRVVALGAGAALALALPATLLAQVLDALADDGDTPALVFALVPVVLAGMVFGGWVVGRRGTPPVVGLGALAGLVAIALVQTLGVVRRLVADEAVAWGGVPAFLALGAALGVAGAALGRRADARTLP